MRYCGRDFTLAEIDLIRDLLNVPRMNRARLSREVCERLGWRRENGGLKDMSCRVALLRMQTDGLITLPPPRNPKPVTYRSYPHIEQAVLEPATLPDIDLATLTVDPVLTRADSLLWNAYIERHHYLGHQLMPGAQLRYFVRSADHRQRNLHLVVNNARFLILPWIHRKNLASRILALVSRRLPEDWQSRYAYRPVLLETFVEKPRFTGTCYKAANWRNLGDTQGRGKLDVLHRYAQPIKSIWIYPLTRDFQHRLCNG